MNFACRNPNALAKASEAVSGAKLPCLVTVLEGASLRTYEQNRLQRKWCQEIADHFGDRTAEQVRGEMKLTIGVPILRAENEAFAEKYDAHVKPLSYEDKLAIMQEPLDLPVTRIMSVAQKRKYLDAAFAHYSAQGVQLTVPKDD